ncbi:MAG: exosome complex RNA-binding protein Rrp4 [Thermosphaera sp.]
MKLKIIVADRQLVRPGDTLAYVEEVSEPIGFRKIPEKHIYILGNKVFSDVIGVVNVNGEDLQVIPLEGVYIPKKDDLVIGIVENVGVTAWTLDIRSPYPGVLNASEVIEGFNPLLHNLRNYLDIGDFVVGRISLFDRTRDPVITVKGKGLGKIVEGIVVDVKPSKVPRLIGKKGSMHNILTSMSGCDITIAQNGFVWLKCPDENRAKVLIQAIKLIELKAHVRGLTEEVKMFLEKRIGGGGSSVEQ